jgi:hypothetical protein
VKHVEFCELMFVLSMFLGGAAIGFSLCTLLESLK